MRMNARVPGGDYSSFQTQAYIMADLVDELDRVFQGYEKERCILQSELNAPNTTLRWESREGTELQGKKMRIRFYLRAADIFAVTG